MSEILDELRLLEEGTDLRKWFSKLEPEEREALTSELTEILRAMTSYFSFISGVLDELAGTF